MIPPSDRRAVIAVDLGAQSCRISLLRWRSDAPHIELVYRMENAPISRDGHLRWDLSAICKFADDGLQKCAGIADEGIDAIGVTGWAVDYVRLKSPVIANSKSGASRAEPISNPFCYRDSRNLRAMEALHRRISPERMYALTGIQVLSINTIYQLYADQAARIPDDLAWLNLPEYMLYRWGARPVAEYTNATHSGMVALGTMQWSQEIFSAAGLDLSAAPEIVPPGSIVGRLQGPLGTHAALRDTLLIAPACHDTASAIAGIPAHGSDWAYISSGTWSLVGTLLDRPCAGPDAAEWNFTNEGGVGGKVCFLRNVNGLWLLNQCMQAWETSGQCAPLANLLCVAETISAPDVLLDIDAPGLMEPGNMPQKIQAQLRRKGNDHPDMSPAAIVGLILHSLAARYATVLHRAEKLTARQFDRLFIVGGGSKNRLLNRLTEQATGVKVLPGASESSTLGNFAVQLAVLEKKNRDSHAGAAVGVIPDAVASWAGVLGNSLETAQAWMPER